MSSEEHFLSETPVAIAIESLQKQINQLKTILHDSSNGEQTLTTSAGNENSQDLELRIKQLETANAKTEYRIVHLLRALEERDAKP